MKRFPVPFIFVFLCLFSSVVFVAAAQEKLPQNVTPVSFKYTFITHPLRIPVMKNMNFPGSEIVIEEILPKGDKYNRFIVSYLSEHKKIYGVLAIPHIQNEQNRLPGILLAHGYVPPAEYDNKHEYADLIDALASNGYVVFMPDLRGHGISEGVAEGAYFSPAYTIDFLNAFSSFTQYKDVDPENIGVLGHSMGGNIVLRSIIAEKKIKSAVIWSGVVGSYADLLYNWNSKTAWNSSSNPTIVRPDVLIGQFGSMSANPQFWDEISPTSYLQDITIPIQLHHAINDRTVPVEFSQNLYHKLVQEKKRVELYVYEHADHALLGEDYPLVLSNTLHFFNSTLE